MTDEEFQKELEKRTYTTKEINQAIIEDMNKNPRYLPTEKIQNDLSPENMAVRKTRQFFGLSMKKKKESA